MAWDMTNIILTLINPNAACKVFICRINGFILQVCLILIQH